jgi:ABC-type antimicrobial peptide transport system permease subunit
MTAVWQRVREIGVRLAIGATPRAIVRQILHQAFVWAGLGLVVGVAGALMLSELLASTLYGLRAVDPVTAVITRVVLFVGIAFAAWRPARHASHIDPMPFLRSE